MADTALLDQLGIGVPGIFTTQGKVAEENFSKILDLFAKKTKAAPETLSGASNGFKMYAMAVQSENKVSTIVNNRDKLFQAIAALGIANDAPKSSEYKGDVFVANELAEGMSTACSMDASQTLAATLAPLAFATAEKILSTRGLGYKVMGVGVPDTADISRANLVQNLMRICPFSGEASIPNGLKVVALILKSPKQQFPELLHIQARSSLQSLTNVARGSLSHAAGDIMELVKVGGNDGLLMNFISMQELYTNSPAVVHDNLDRFLKQPYMQYSSLFMRVGQAAPSVLLPHLDFFVQQLSSSPATVTVTLMTLAALATKDPNLVFQHRAVIVSKGKAAPSGSVGLSQCLGKLALAFKPRNASDAVFLDLVELLDSATESYAKPAILAEISNAMFLLSSRRVLVDKLDQIAKHRGASEIIFTSIDDYANERSLEKLTLRVEVLDAKVNALNSRVSETCTNMADVIAYVDANMADMKDFLAQVAKKLPQPKRLEVVGTLRKTLILHFECARTGLEFPITSHEWSKWLKIGFSLVKAGQAVIDLGMGNPLGILKKGVECVQEIYTAYKTNDDDEFNTYITNPFLLSTEQDQLLEKLRAQGFFEIFAYDAQVAGWYLLNPDKDGRAPEGEAGSVSKVWTKKGYGVTEGLVAAASEALGAGVVDLGEGSGIASAALGVAGDAAQSLSGKSSSPLQSPVASAGSPSSKSLSPVTQAPANSGGRAAALKEQFGPSAAKSAEEKVADAGRTVMYQQKVDQLENKVTELDRRVQELSAAVNAMHSRRSACCVIS